MHESTLYFYGAAGAVTGSNFLLDTGPSTSLEVNGTKIMVDCGLMHGVGEERNWHSFAYDPKVISHLIVTHAHLDHIGRIPKLVKDGFRGKIISTKATISLAEPLLFDAMEILAHGAKLYSREPLFDEADIAAALGRWSGIGYHEKVQLQGGVELELLDAGHILGSAMARFSRKERSILFTGDLGGGNSPLLPPTERVSGDTYVVMECTYGDTTRPEDPLRRERLEDVIEDAARRGGALLIPAFSTERTQDLIFDIRRLMVEKRVPQMPVFLDSPLAQKITRAYVAHPEYFSADIKARIEAGEEIFSFPELRCVPNIAASRKIKDTPNPKIIVAGSGMSSGGRVIAHELEYLPDPHSTVLIVGYQAAGTIGRRLIEGAKTLKLYKEHIPVRATVTTLYGYSAHKDSESLLEFANETAGSAEEVFLVHGEPASAAFLAQRIRDYLGVKATVPSVGESAKLNF